MCIANSKNFLWLRNKRESVIPVRNADSQNDTRSIFNFIQNSSWLTYMVLNKGVIGLFEDEYIY